MESICTALENSKTILSVYVDESYEVRYVAYVRLFEVPLVLCVKITVSWDVTLRSLIASTNC